MEETLTAPPIDAAASEGREDLDSEADDVGLKDSHTAPSDDGFEDASAAGHGRGDSVDDDERKDWDTAASDGRKDMETSASHGRGDMATVASDDRGDMATVAPDGRGDRRTTPSNALHGSTSAEANVAGDESLRSKRAGLSDKADDLPPTNSGKKPKESEKPKELEKLTTASEVQILYQNSLKFAEDAATSSMASESVNFLRAVEEFRAGKDTKKKKVTDAELCKAALVLSDAARRAPSTEAALAAAAIKITGDSSLISLSPEDQRSGPCDFCSRCLERLRAAVWAPEPTLPLHCIRQRQEKLADQRQALFGVALAAPVALLTSAAALQVQVFPSALVPWITVISAILWIAVSLGLVMDLYGKSKLEFQFASCLSRVGMIGVTVLFCFFVFGVFFPSAKAAMWALVICAVVLHASLCVLSRTRASNDEASSSTNNSEASRKMGSKCCGCNCSCSLDV